MSADSVMSTRDIDPLNRFRLDDNVVIVTGASSGLGVGFSRAVAAVGATVVLAARRQDRIETLAAELRKRGTSVLTKRTDVAAQPDCDDLAAAVVAEYGRIDVLINNAGVGSGGSALRQKPDAFRTVIDINLNGTYWMAKACAPHMLCGSSIVNVASVLGLVASRYPQAAYTASKAGVIGLTKDLAQQWSGRRGIRVNALCPGFFDSEITASEGAENLRAMVKANSILGRYGEQHELDSALLFLASPASSYVTGTTLTVDGGLSTTL
jgi:NAD(P)-dependent dehydrogenase (short-subunit alcohol dehydrogenase family)